MSVRSVLRSVRRSLYWPRDYLFCKWKGLVWASSWQFHGLPLVFVVRGARVNIGERFICTSDPRMNSIGLIQKTNIRVGRPDAAISIGDDVGISGATLSATMGISIGHRVFIGSGCLISDSDAHPLSAVDRHDRTKIGRAAIRIGDDCFIGARSIILKGVTIGERSVIGAGSVVSSDIPAGVIAAGNPAKVVREI